MIARGFEPEVPQSQRNRGGSEAAPFVDLGGSAAYDQRIRNLGLAHQ